MEGRSLRTTLVGQDAVMPLAISPTGLTGMQHADGEILAAKAAADFGAVSYTHLDVYKRQVEDPRGWRHFLGQLHWPAADRNRVEGNNDL